MDNGKDRIRRTSGMEGSVPLNGLGNKEIVDSTGRVLY